MERTTAMENQNLMDLTIQECGGIASLFDFALLNGHSVTEPLTIGAKFDIPAVKASPEIAAFFEKQGIRIASSGSATQTASLYAVNDYVEQNYWI